MKIRKADLGCGVAAIFVYPAALAVRFATDGSYWFCAGMFAGGFTWIVLRHAAYRLLERASDLGERLGTVMLVSFELLCAPASMMVGGLLMDRPPDIREFFFALAPVFLSLTLGCVAAAILGTGFTLYREARRKRGT